jgi:hypothetical protein
MSRTVVLERTSSTRLDAAVRTPPRPDTPAPARRVLLAVALLLAVYGALAAFVDTRATLGSDTGAKVATLRVMADRGALDPDVGYWAAAHDPDGHLHPLYNSSAVGHRWVNVTTLPMLYAAYPLYRLGGERAVLLLPMVGAALTALAARALARRLGGGDGWTAFWAVGLASPILVYALDFWEHALGVAAIGWAVVALVDLVAGRAGGRGALGMGLLLGLGATMRTEALVYAAAMLAVLVGTGVWSRRAWSAARRAGVSVVGIVVVLALNDGLERLTRGGELRADRASDAARVVGSRLVDRLEEALATTLGLTRFPDTREYVLGAVVVIVVAVASWALANRSGATDRVALVGVGASAVLYGARLAGGLDFIPGLLTASPLAVAGVVLWLRRRPLRDGDSAASGWVVAAVALLAVPLVWAFQYVGGAGPQWGARYALPSSILLAVLGVVGLQQAGGRKAVVVMVGLGAVVSMSGAAWVARRTHVVGEGMAHLVARDDPGIVSRERFLLREGGP